MLVAIIGIALLAFVIGDFLNSGVTYFNRSRENVGEIEGDEIHFTSFQNAVDQMIEVYKIETGQNDLGEELTAQLRATVWESMVSERLMQAEAAKIGLVVSQEELTDRLIGNNIHPIIMQRGAFYDENGRFSRTILINFLNWLDLDATDGNMYAQIQQGKTYWLYWENAVKNEILREKFNTLMAKAITANQVDAKAAFDAGRRSVNFSYIVQPYYMLPDSTVNVTQSEVQQRYNQNKELYKQNESRSINYVLFEVNPREDDYRQAQEWMDKVSEEFRTTDDIAGLINSDSDVMYDGRNYSERTVPALLKDFAFSGEEGDFFGPVFIDDTHTMARIMQTGLVTPDSVRLSHIFLLSTDEERADSIYNVLHTDPQADFAALAREFSLVQQTASNGGEIGWITEDMRGIDKEFMSAFEKEENEVFMFKNAQGIQIVKVLEKTEPLNKVKLAILERKVTAGNRTQAQIYNEAKQLAGAANSVSSFQAKVNELGLVIRIANSLDKNAERISVIPQSRQIVRWAFNEKVDAVSDVFECGEQFIVAVVTESNEKGYTPLSKVSQQIRSELIREKKAELMMAGLSAKIAEGKSLEDLAKELDVEVREADNVTFASYSFGSAGFEPSVIGKGMKLEANQLSQPIKGNSGVYVLLPTHVTESAGLFNAETEISRLNSRNLSSLAYSVYQDMYDHAEVVDNRANFY